MCSGAKFGFFSPYRCQVRNVAPFLPRFPNYVILPSIFDVFQKVNITIGFPIGKYIWMPSLSILVKPVVMLQALIASIV